MESGGWSPDQPRVESENQPQLGKNIRPVAGLPTSPQKRKQHKKII